MRPRLPTSLRARLLLLLGPLLLLTWLAAALWTWRDTRHELDELLDGHLAQAAAMLVVQQTRPGHGGRSGDDDDDDDERGVDAPLLHKYAPRVAFQVWHDGRLSLRSSNAPHEPMRAAGQPFRPGFANLPINGEDWRVMAAAGAQHDVQVYVGELQHARGDILRAVLRGGGVALALALPVMLLAALWAVHAGTAPLRRLGRELSQRPPQALQPVQLADPPAELRPLIDALNGLFGRIGQLLESERRFTADAAHELRTPIAAIRTQAQVAMGEADDALRHHALQATLDGCDRATRLVEQLLTLSRLEAEAPLQCSPVDLAALAQRVAAELAPRALARGQQLDLLDERPAGTPALVQGNDTLLAVLLRNLLDNALRYSPDGAHVRLRLQAGAGHVTVQVADSGPGLAEADLARLGERFFRVLGTGQPGSGLGWSIARRIAQAHGHVLQAQRSTALGGLEIVLTAPTTTPDRIGSDRSPTMPASDSISSGRSPATPAPDR